METADWMKSAIGWMLRESGKHSRVLLFRFLVKGEVPEGQWTKNPSRAILPALHSLDYTRAILREALHEPFRFRPQILTALLLITCLRVWAAELRKDTVEAFDHYVADLEGRLVHRWHGDGFLWSDSLPQRDQLERGTTVIQPALGSGNIEIRGGMIQDWIGAIFIPSATLQSVLAVAQDYEHQNEIYEPEIVSARVLSHTGDDFTVYMRILKSKLFLSDILDTEHDIRFVRIDPKRVYSRAYSTRIAEVSDAGKPSERELPVGKDRGLLWRMYGYWFFQERDGGVVVECESVTLTRDVPLGMGKLVGPIIRGLPAESLRKSLESTRKAALSRLSPVSNPESRTKE